MKSYPKSERAARARSRRKLISLRKHADKMLYGIAELFEEGPVSSDADILLDDIYRGIMAIESSMDDEVARSEEREP